jgi:hypothetical protein
MQLRLVYNPVYFKLNFHMKFAVLKTNVKLLGQVKKEENNCDCNDDHPMQGQASNNPGRTGALYCSPHYRLL